MINWDLFTEEYKNGEFDFYYSKKHDDYIAELNKISTERKKDAFIDGVKYTEMIKKGGKPMTNHFGDLELVYSGTSKNITLL